ncbi:excinuclease ABC subunit C [Serinicoccus sp. CNJ-927]|uniref:GIY-YIG nuclease family protein n=1 Tax=Serinicoccus sp. CNJ-927 TaxID=1904970 RepID=UPI00096070C7|nr:GIY-YIG nuclease family protein [Serinicoccus sp. CNJ-927]OLT42367.1 excinuclease ABC subunit C [Serinicoccus sp. CNJ-927]
MTTSTLTLGHVLNALGAEHQPPVGLEEIRVIRHVFKPGHDGHLQGPEDLTVEKVMEYTRRQSVSTRSFPASPERYWVAFVADGQSRSRLWGSFENLGEREDERTEHNRFWSLRPVGLLAGLEGRLVIDWSSPLTWNRAATRAADLPVIEIADRDAVPFPGFDRVLLPFHELQDMVEDSRYAQWRTALSEVQGIYLITDSSTGKQYVGKADGAERILGRWGSYARDGHGGNVGLRSLMELDPQADVTVGQARHLVFSLLRVFGPSTSSSEVDAAESHYKEALLTREFGLNRN